MSLQLELLLFVFCLHVLFIIHFSFNLLSQLPRRLLSLNIKPFVIKLYFVTVTGLLHMLPFYQQEQ